MIAPSKILVPTDFGPTSEIALRYARDLTASFGATLHVLHVVADTVTLGMPSVYGDEPTAMLLDLEADARTRLHAFAAGAPSTPNITEAVIPSSTPATTIVSYATDQKIDLIVMGTNGRGGVAHFLLGSVTERVVRSAPCPVLTVRHAEREWRVVRPPRAAAARPALVRPRARPRRRTVA